MDRQYKKDSEAQQRERTSRDISPYNGKTNKSGRWTGRSRRTGKRSRQRGQVVILDLTTGSQTNQEGGQAGQERQGRAADREDRMGEKLEI
jgi:hypothetical protein